MNSTPSCKHCHGDVETTTSTDNITLHSDACFGCRNRYNQARRAIHQSQHYLEEAQQLLEMYDDDTTGFNLGDDCGRILYELSALHRLTTQ